MNWNQISVITWNDNLFQDVTNNIIVLNFLLKFQYKWLLDLIWFQYLGGKQNGVYCKHYVVFSKTCNMGSHLCLKYLILQTLKENKFNIYI